MSILVKGMNMPTECEFCPFCEDIGGLGCIINHLVILRRHGQDKPSWCPLIEVSDKAVSPCEECPFIKAEVE